MNTATQPRVIEVDVIRHNFYYFMNRREDGETVISAVLITRERAMQILGANKGHGRQRTINTVDFDPIRPAEWSWTMRLEETHETDN